MHIILWKLLKCDYFPFQIILFNKERNQFKMISLRRPEFRIHQYRTMNSCSKDMSSRVGKHVKTESVIESQSSSEKEREMSYQKISHSNQEMVEIFCRLLRNIMANNANAKQIASIFDIKHKVSIEIEAFVARIFTHMKCSIKCYVIAMILLDRIQTYNPNFIISSCNIHKLLLSAMVVAAKYWDDDSYLNSYYAKVGGLAVGELNQLQVQFLTMIRFEVYIEDELYEQYNGKLAGYLRKKYKGRSVSTV